MEEQGTFTIHGVVRPLPYGSHEEYRHRPSVLLLVVGTEGRGTVRVDRRKGRRVGFRVTAVPDDGLDPHPTPRLVTNVPTEVFASCRSRPCTQILGHTHT